MDAEGHVSPLPFRSLPSARESFGGLYGRTHMAVAFSPQWRENIIWCGMCLSGQASRVKSPLPDVFRKSPAGYRYHPIWLTPVAADRLRREDAWRISPTIALVIGTSLAESAAAEPIRWAV